MIRYNCDPTNPLPPSDENGKLILTEATTERFGVFFVLVLSSVWFALTLYFWIAYFQNLVPEIWVNILRIPSFSIPIAFLVMASSFIAAVSPRQLVINEDGISFRKFGFSQRIRWNDICGVTTEEVPVSGQNFVRVGIQTFTKVIGTNQKLGWMPIFKVSPTELARYILNEKNKRSFKNEIFVNDSTSLDVQNFLNIKPRTMIVSFIFLVIIIEIISISFHISFRS